MPGIAQRITNICADNLDVNTNGKLPFQSFNGSSVSSSNGFWSQHRDDMSYSQLQKFWCELTPQARQNLLRIDKQTLFEHARKNMYCSRCNGLLLEGFLQIVMYGKSLQQDTAGIPYSVKSTDYHDESDLCIANGSGVDVQDPSVHPWGGLTTARDGTLTLLDCYLCSKSLKGLQNVFDSARARERERELLYPDACGGGGRGWISQGVVGYGRGHGTRESCALHTARLSVETLVDFWSALGEETRQSLLRMKEEDFIERLMYRFDSKRFCRDCRRNVIREFKELKELKRMRKETRCTTWFCVADTAFQYEVSRDTVQADWHQTFSDTFGTYHHFEWAIGTGEGKSDILEFENVGLSGRVQVNGLDLSGQNACFITVRACKTDGRFNELCVKAHALRGQQCVHCRLVVGDGFVSITRGESITRFFEHAEEAEEEEDDDSMDKDGNDIDIECSRPQKHAKSPELAREFLLDAATVIFKEQVEKAFREGTARQNAHSIFVCLALKLLEERVHVACKEIITLEKQMKLLEEEEKEKRDEEERKERKRTKEREKKLRRKERLREKENREKKCSDPVVADALKEESTPSVDEEGINNDNDIDDNNDNVDEGGEVTQSSPLLSPDIQEIEYSYSNMENTSFPYDHVKYSRRKLKFRKDSQRDLNVKWSDRRKGPAAYESRCHSDGFNGFNKQLRTNAAKSNLRYPTRSNSKFQCSNNRICDNRYDSQSCSCNHHPDYRSRLGRDFKYVNKLEINNRPKSKTISGNNTPIITKKVWEPLDSRKKCIRSNSDSDVTLRSTSKIEPSESDRLPECCSTSSDEVTDIISVQTNHEEDNYARDLTRSSADNGFHTKEKKPQDSSTTNSDSEESSRISDGKENPDRLENTWKKGQDGKIQEHNSVASNVSVIGGQPQSVVPQMHNNRNIINYPIFRGPTVGCYYHQNNPVSWQSGPVNGLISFPHSNHYLFPNGFGYGLNGNTPFVQYGLAPPLINHAHVPVFQPISQVNGVTTTKEPPTKVMHKIPKMPSTDQSDSPTGVNNGFSLFHFGGPVALSTGFKADPVSVNEGVTEDKEKSTVNCKDSIEEYNLFAANNGIKFSIF